MLDSVHDHSRHPRQHAVDDESGRIVDFHGRLLQFGRQIAHFLGNQDAPGLVDGGPHEVDDRLHKIMIAIHKNCFETAERYGTPGNYLNGANIGGFLKVANSMMDQGLV